MSGPANTIRRSTISTSSSASWRWVDRSRGLSPMPASPSMAPAQPSPPCIPTGLPAWAYAFRPPIPPRPFRPDRSGATPVFLRVRCGCCRRSPSVRRNRRASRSGLRCEPIPRSRSTRCSPSSGPTRWRWTGRRGRTPRRCPPSRASGRGRGPGRTTASSCRHPPTKSGTVRAADQIVVMDQGVVDAVGTHSQLVETSALYRDLARRQFLAAE